MGSEQPTRRITSLRSQRRHSGRANLYVDGEFECGVAWDLVLEQGLHTGDEVTPEALARLRAADEEWKAKQAALSLLATRARARRELMDRLRQKGFAAPAIDHAIAEVDRLGLLDDRAFAEAWVADRLRGRPRGARALLAELGRKGVAAETARAAVERVMQVRETDDAQLCIEAARKWARTQGGDAVSPDGQPMSAPAAAAAGSGRPSNRRGRATDFDLRRRTERRLTAYLTRRGFGSGHIRRAVRDVLGDRG